MALEALKNAAVLHTGSNTELHRDAEFREQLLKVARTTLSSKLLTHHREHFAELAVNAILRLKGSGNLDAIQIIQKLGGTLSDSYLDEGFLLDKKIGVNQPNRIENAKILIANTPMDADKIKIFGSKIRVDAISKIADLEIAEKEKMKKKVEKIIGHGCNVFVNRQLIYNYPEQLFADAGVMAIEHADFEGVERLALVTGGEIVSTFDAPETTKLGHCDLIEEVSTYRLIYICLHSVLNENKLLPEHLHVSLSIIDKAPNCCALKIKDVFDSLIILKAFLQI